MMSMKQKRVKFKARIKLSHNTYALVQLHKIHMLISSIPFGRVFMTMNLKQKKNKILSKDQIKPEHTLYMCAI